jgi:A/G-specific adenine glycosylase
MMELGATVCRPKNPDCPKCPVQSECLGKSHPLDFPKKLAKKAVVSVHEKCVVLVSQNQVLLAQNQKGEWREGLWDFPKVLPAAQIKKANWVSEFSLKYVVTHHRVLRDHHVFLISKPTALRQENLKWFALQELPGVPAPVKKALTRIKTP